MHCLNIINNGINSIMVTNISERKGCAMSKIIDINKSIYELCNEYPEIPEILQSLGLKDITKPGMISTVGRFMTLPKGAKAKGIELEKIKQEFIRLGYEIRE